MLEINELELCYEEEELCELESMSGASSDEILVYCLDKLGRVDIVEMSRSSGKSCEELVLDLRGSAIFQDPSEFEGDESWSIEKGWQLSAQYGSGNLRRKLTEAIRMNRRFPGCFDCNVAFLEKHFSEYLCLDDIHVALGAPWLTEDVYADFIKDLLKLRVAPEVIFNKELNTWRIIPPDEASTSVLNKMTFGTVDFSAIKIIEYTMNAKSVKVYDYIPTRDWKYERVFNKDATLNAQEKQKAIIREFEEWVHKDEKLGAYIEECYNESFVGYNGCKYDGSFLSLPDLNPEVVLYDHQRSSVARGLLSEHNLLLAKDVGTGKTYIMIVLVHELYRMGISRKNLTVVPNNVFQATVDAHRYLYPDDKIFAVYPDRDFNPKSRQRTLEEIRDGDYVTVYMTQSSFDMTVMSKDYWMKKMTQDITDITNAISSTSNKEEVRMLKKELEALVKKRSLYAKNGSDTPWLTYDKLGIETLVVDEAHHYKNIPLKTRADNIVGLNTAGSKKCREMVEKVKIAKKVVMATGTPLTNSLAELFVLQSYLQPEELKFRGLDSFDMWLNTFAQRETSFEIDVDSKNLKYVTRFSTFHNITELMSLFSVVCDFYKDDSNDNELPVFNGYIDVCIPRSEAQARYIAELSKRTDLVREHLVKRTEDNLLKITTDGRLCALDIRLVDGDYFDDNCENKIEACAKKVFELYLKYPDTCQAVFSDIGTPKAGFNVYDSLKYELMGLGIPEHRIAFIHDATSEKARSRLFAAINAGSISVVVGSTAKLGVGVNMQERLVAAHHLSIPWKSSDLHQREGRLIRRGNSCPEVFVYRYVTEGSFDAYSYQLLENKQQFISSFLAGVSNTRVAEDVDDLVLNYAEIKALAIGDPLIKKRVETSNRLERAMISCRQRQKQLAELRAVVDNVPAELEKLKEHHAVASADIELYAKSRESIRIDERTAFGEELIEAIRDNHMKTTERLFDRYQGFDIYLPANMDRERPHVYVRSSNGGAYYLDMETDKALGCAMRIDYLLEHLPERVSDYEEKMARAEKQREQALCDLENGNPYQTVVEEIKIELREIDTLLAEKETA